MMHMRGLLSVISQGGISLLIMPDFDSYDGTSVTLGDKIRAEFAFTKGQTEKKVNLTGGNWVNLNTMETYQNQS